MDTPPKHKNHQGGFDPQTPEQMAKWKAVDLITLPSDVTGTNCSNCMHVSKQQGTGYCTHPEIQDFITQDMCCAKWNNKGVKRLWE